MALEPRPRVRASLSAAERTVRLKRIAVALSLLFLTASPAAAGPAEVVVASTAGQLYAPQTVVVPVGTPLRLVQLDPAARHDVVSRSVRRGRPLFGNGRTLSFGETALVARVESLKPATYAFTCSVHEFMSGRLIVQG